VISFVVSIIAASTSNARVVGFLSSPSMIQPRQASVKEMCYCSIVIVPSSSSSSSTSFLRQSILGVEADITATMARARALIEKSKAKLEKQENQQQQQIVEEIGHGRLLRNHETTSFNDADSTATSSTPVATGAGAAATERYTVEQPPFFATKVLRSKIHAPSTSSLTSSRNRPRADVIKEINQQTGLVRADGEKMAALSEQEEWQRRPLYEVFNVIEVASDSSDVQYQPNTSKTSRTLDERDMIASIRNLQQTLHNEDFKRIFDEKNRYIGEQY
jgi:hypothetical protein